MAEENDTPPVPGNGEVEEEDEEVTGALATPPLARVPYGLGKEIRLYPDAIVVLLREEHEELRYSLANIRRLVLTPGEYNPGKLVLMFELDDGNTVIAAEGLSNVRGFRNLLARLKELQLPIELDPPNMDEELRQALTIRSRYLLGCYGFALAACALLVVIYVVGSAVFTHHH
jgi:hypothetical protein